MAKHHSCPPTRLLCLMVWVVVGLCVCEREIYNGIRQVPLFVWICMDDWISSGNLQLIQQKDKLLHLSHYISLLSLILSWLFYFCCYTIVSHVCFIFIYCSFMYCMLDYLFLFVLVGVCYTPKCNISKKILKKWTIKLYSKNISSRKTHAQLF